MAPAFRQTAYSDVCGTVDELKRLAAGAPSEFLAADSKVAGSLLDDTIYMIERMRERVDEYKALREGARALLAGLDGIEDVALAPAYDGARRIREAAEAENTPTDTDVARIHEQAERIRKVAGNHEERLRQYKDQALKLYDLFNAVKGDRPWIVDQAGDQCLNDQYRRRYQAWLPPEPHAEVLIDWMTRDRLTVAEQPLKDGQPAVLFDDGGSIPMSQVRWSDHIRNFHPASAAPGPAGPDPAANRDVDDVLPNDPVA